RIQRAPAIAAVGRDHSRVDRAVDQSPMQSRSGAVDDVRAGEHDAVLRRVRRRHDRRDAGRVHDAGDDCLLECDERRETLGLCIFRCIGTRLAGEGPAGAGAHVPADHSLAAAAQGMRASMESNTVDFGQRSRAGYQPAVVYRRGNKNAGLPALLHRRRTHQPLSSSGMGGRQIWPCTCRTDRHDLAVLVLRSVPVFVHRHRLAAQALARGAAVVPRCGRLGVVFISVVRHVADFFHDGGKHHLDLCVHESARIRGARGGIVSPSTCRPRAMQCPRLRIGKLRDARRRRRIGRALSIRPDGFRQAIAARCGCDVAAAAQRPGQSARLLSEDLSVGVVLHRGQGQNGRQPRRTAQGVEQRAKRFRRGLYRRRCGISGRSQAAPDRGAHGGQHNVVCRAPLIRVP
ncbi:conserved hypothetical protein, partial [Ricinus communis]